MNLKKKTMTVLFLVLVTLGASAFVYSQDWPMSGQNPENTGYSPSSGPSTGDLQWVYEIKGLVLSSPAVANGKVYIGGEDGTVYCLDAYTGAWKWEYTTGIVITSSPTVADNKVFFCSDDGKVYCLNGDTGAWIWDAQIGPSPYSPVVVDSPSLGPGLPSVTLVIVCSEDGDVYFLNADNGNIGYVKEQNPPDVSPIYASPTVADGRIYYAWYDSQVRAMDLSGASCGGYKPDGVPVFPVVSSPAVADGKLYVGSEDRKIYCFDVDTHVEIWNYQTGYDITSSPAVADGKVYIYSEDGKVYCLNAYSGAWNWQYTAGLGMSSSPAVADNKVYISGGDGNVYCLNAYTGARIWDYSIEDYIYSPAVADGRVYITSYSGNVYCLGSTLEERIASLEAENPANWINLDILPGTRINIYTEGEFQISAKETTHIWQGWYAGPWSTLDEAQRTEFLATAEVHFYVNDEEISLKPLVVYDEENDRMWSGYYRVFPPSYFELNRNNKLTAEWFRMRDGEWRSIHRTALLRIK